MPPTWIPSLTTTSASTLDHRDVQVWDDFRKSAFGELGRIVRSFRDAKSSASTFLGEQRDLAARFPIALRPQYAAKQNDDQTEVLQAWIACTAAAMECQGLDDIRVPAAVRLPRRLGCDPKLCEEWCEDCVRQLLDPEGKQACQVRVSQSFDTAFAIVREVGGGALPALVLRLEVLKGGKGQVYQDPANALSGLVDASFCDAMSRAGLSVLAGRPKQPEDSLSVSLRWSIVGGTTRFVAEGSASGEAARAWHLLIRRTPVDRGVVALAEVNPAGHLGDVSGVGDKIVALLAHEEERFDTFCVVAVQDQVGQAVAKLEQEGWTKAPSGPATQDADPRGEVRAPAGWALAACLRSPAGRWARVLAPAPAP